MTAYQFLYQESDKIDNSQKPLGLLRDEYVEEIMIEFAKYHVEQALKEASEKCLLKFSNYKGDWESIETFSVNQYTDLSISKDSILNSYPLENIK